MKTKTTRPNNNLYSSIGDTVRCSREERGMTQTQLATAIGTHQPVIANLESGKAKPSISFLERIAKALGAEVQINMRV